MDVLLHKIKDRKANLISYKLLSRHPIGNHFELSKGVKSQRLKDNSDGTMLFKITLEKGSMINAHYHDCVQDTVLLKGKILEVCSNKEIKDNKIFRMNSNQVHAFYAIEESTIYAQLFKPTKK